MYVALNCDKVPIGIHNDADVITQFVIYSNEPATIVQVPRKKAKKIHNYEGLFLTRCGDIYLPNDLYEVAEEDIKENLYEYKQVRDTLYRLVEHAKISKDSINHIQKTLVLIEGIIYDLEENRDYGERPLKLLREIKDLKDEYHNTLG